MDFDYDLLTHPLPQDFLDWYPYDKLESFHDASGLAWLRGMRKVTGNQLPGLRHTFVVAKAGGEYAGVCWLCESEATPELAHYGWFLVEEKHRGKGAGRGILDRAMDYVDGRGIEMTMLPTRTTTEHARGMYGRRGFEDFLVEDGGGCWMVRAPKGHYDRYFARTGEVECGDFAACDYIAFDYLINGVQWYPRGGQAQSRLSPMGLVGDARIVSFKELGDAHRLFAGRVDGRLKAVAVVKDGELDFYSHAPSASPALVQHVLGRVSGPLTCHVAKSDEWKRQIVEGAGLSRTDADSVEAPGGKTIEFGVYART